MRTARFAALIAPVAMLAGYARAGEAGKQDKGKRIAEINERIGFLDRSSAEAEKSIPVMRAKGKTTDADWNQERLDKWQAERAELLIERDWMSGELTLDKATAEVKAAEDAVSKAKDGEKPDKEKALQKAQRKLERVKALEAKGEF